MKREELIKSEEELGIAWRNALAPGPCLLSVAARPHDHDDSEKDNVSRGLIHDVHGCRCYDRHNRVVQEVCAMFRSKGICCQIEVSV